jgi:hypothetical protein
MMQGWSTLVKDRQCTLGTDAKQGGCQASNDVSRVEGDICQLGGGMHAVVCSM